MKAAVVRMLKGTIVGLALVALAACGNVVQAPASPDAVPSAEAVNESLEAMAKVFAKAVSDEGLRQQIHDLAAQRFDGDTNVLYKTLVSQPQVSQSLAQAYSESGLSTQAQGDALAALERLASTIPRFQVAVPARFEAWDAQTYTPLVGFAPEGVDDTTLKTITAFDAQGNAHTLDAQLAPERPVIILSVNERTDEAGNLLEESLPASEGLAPQWCKRHVHMNAVRLRNDKEPWIKGNPEVWLIAATTANYDLGYHGSFGAVNDEYLTYWYYRHLGCSSVSVVYYWYENDGGSYDITVSYRGVSLGFKIDDSDDFYGAVRVSNGYFNSTSTPWDLGNLVFWSN